MTRSIPHGYMKIDHIPTAENMVIIDNSFTVILPEEREDEWKNELEELIKRYTV